MTETHTICDLCGVKDPSSIWHGTLFSLRYIDLCGRCAKEMAKAIERVWNEGQKVPVTVTVDTEDP